MAISNEILSHRTSLWSICRASKVDLHWAAIYIGIGGYYNIDINIDISKDLMHLKAII